MWPCEIEGSVIKKNQPCAMMTSECTSNNFDQVRCTSTERKTKEHASSRRGKIPCLEI